MNYRMVFRTTGQVVLLEAAFLVLPLFVSLLYREYSVALAFSFAAAIALLTGAVLVHFLKPKNNRIFTRDGFVIVVLSWLALSLIGCIPYIISGEIPGFVDAFYETVSGFTTTGSTILTDIEAMSHGLLFWRVFTQWLGGMGVLVFIMAIASKAPDRSINIMRAEMPGPSMDKIVPKARSMAKILYYIYLALTATEVIFLLCGGLPLFDSVIHALGTAATGGFGIKADSVASYSPYVQWVICVFMMLFGVNFALYYLLIMRHFRTAFSGNEIRTYILIAMASVVIISVNIYPMYKNLEETLRLSCFQVAAFLTTTCYTSVDYDMWPTLSKGMLFILMFLGGCSGSTSGGLKLSRVVVLAQVIRNELRRVVHPRVVNTVRLNGKQVDSAMQSSITSYFTLYMVTIFFTFLLLSLDQYDITTNISAAVSAVNNIGPGFNAVGPNMNYSEFSVFSKIVLTLAMLLGRLEIYPLLVTLTPGTWKK